MPSTAAWSVLDGDDLGTTRFLLWAGVDMLPAVKTLYKGNIWGNLFIYYFFENIYLFLLKNIKK
jgi:hypothetical protein